MSLAPGRVRLSFCAGVGLQSSGCKDRPAAPGEEGVKSAPAAGAQALAQLPEMRVAAQNHETTLCSHALLTRRPGNCTVRWQGLAAPAPKQCCARN